MTPLQCVLYHTCYIKFSETPPVIPEITWGGGQFPAVSEITSVLHQQSWLSPDKGVFVCLSLWPLPADMLCRGQICIGHTIGDPWDSPAGLGFGDLEHRWREVILQLNSGYIQIKEVKIAGNFEFHSFMLWIPQGVFTPPWGFLHLATKLPEVQT